MFKTLLTTRDLSCQMPVGILFSNVSISIKEQDRIGLVGRNGVGKTTLLKILCGRQEPESGTVIKNGCVGYVPQITNESNQPLNVDEWLKVHNSTYGKFSQTYRSIFSSSVPSENSLLNTLSGGESTKLWIALVVSFDPEVLLLDEPTNHLDVKSLTELSDWINKFNGAIVLVSHYRVFLSEITNTIWELNNGTLVTYGGGYENFLQEKKKIMDAKDRQYEATKKDLNFLLAGMHKRETKTARANRVGDRNKKEPSRSKAMEDYFRNRSEKGVGKIKKQQEAKLSQVKDKLNLLKRGKIKTINLPLHSPKEGKKLIIEVRGLDVEVESTVLIKNINLRILSSNRIAILGDNGSGKTTLVKKLLSEIKHPTKGVSKVGEGVVVAHIDQNYELVDKNSSVFENLEKMMNSTDMELIYQQLGRFQFPEYYLHKKAGDLSGGEIARLAFAMVTTLVPDLLILDEPTNNLDVETIEIIEEALKNYDGALLVISHDKLFLESLGIKSTYIISEKQLLVK